MAVMHCWYICLNTARFCVVTVSAYGSDRQEVAAAAVQLFLFQEVCVRIKAAGLSLPVACAEQEVLRIPVM